MTEGMGYFCMQKNSRHYYITVVSFNFRRDESMSSKAILTIVITVLAEVIKLLQEKTKES